MSEPKTLLKKWRFGVVAFICLAVMILIAWTPSRAPQNQGVAVKNRTASLQVIGAVKEGNDIRIRLKNISNKDINGYTLALINGVTITQDYTEGDFVFPPGKIEETVIPAATSSPSGEADLEQSITVLAAVFTDNSSEGDFKAAAEIKDRRRGIKKQLSRIIPLLRAALNASDTDLPAKLSEFKSQILALPERADNGLPRAVGHGLYDTKQDLLLVIQKIEQSQQGQTTTDTQKLRKQLMEALRESEKKDSKL